jgi:hypothetical protein
MELKKSSDIPIKKKNIQFSEASFSTYGIKSKSYDSIEKKRVVVEYEIELEPLGRGSFATVYKGIDCQTGEIVAIKKISLDKLSTVKINRFIPELDMAISLDNHNVLKSFRKLRTERHLYIVSEYCDEGTLVEAIGALKLITDHIEREKKVKTILVQLKDAMKYLADKKILHRDIKPANILFKREDNEIVLKLADFGFSKYFDINFEEDINPKDMMTMTVCGSPIYMAPEMILNKKPSIKSDLWSFGVVMYEMLYGFNPYNSPTTCDMLAKRMINQTIEYEKIFCEDCIILLKSLLTVEPEKRIGWKDFFKCKWFIEAEKMIIVDNESLPFEFQLSDEDDLQKTEKKSQTGSNECYFNNDVDFLMKNKKKIIPKIKTFGKINLPSSKEKSISYEFDDDNYVFIEKDQLDNSNNEICQSYSGSYIRIVSGLSPYWPFSKSY